MVKITSEGAAVRRRRFDPDRRQRIAAAAVDVVSKWGVEGLTHRRVAAAAKVPLGSMTYHFSSLEELLEVAIELAASRNKVFWQKWNETLPPDPDLPEELTTLLVDVFASKERHRTIVQVELYLAAMRRPSLRAASIAWGKVIFDALVRHTDPGTARALALMLEGLSNEALVAGKPPTRQDCLAVFRRVRSEPG